MLRPIIRGLAGIIRHASWWLEWHARSGLASGSRELTDVELQPCESS
jgi:hypothetical protein